MRLSFAFTAFALCGISTVLAADASQSITPTCEIALSTVTSSSVFTSYVTVLQQTTAVPTSSVSVSSSSSFYYFIDTSGTTSWLNGVSPGPTYSSYVTKTVEVTISPTASEVSEVTVVQTETLTVTPPASTSIEYPTSRSALTTTSTVTSYMTLSATSVVTVYSTSSSSQAEATFSALSLISSGYGPTFSVPDWNASYTSVIPGTGASMSTAGPANASACSISSVHLTTNVTYTVMATTSAKKSSLVDAAVFGTAAVYNTSVHGASSPAYVTGNWVSMPLVTASPTMSSTLSKIYTNTSSFAVASTVPSVCGEHGDFTLTWDDEPTFVPNNPITDPSDAPPVFNPYHHLYFSSGYIYMPPPSGPFPPISAPRLVMFLTNETGPSGNTNAGAELSGEIGAGIHRTSNAFWFNAYSAYLGCDNKGPDDCIMQVTGLVYQKGTNSEVPAYQQNITVPPCPGFQNCQLKQFQFAKSMRGLSGIRIQAFVGNEQRPWFMDNLALGWSNNTCEAGLLRLRSH